MNQVTIRTSTKGTGYYVSAPYNVKALDAWRKIQGRKFDRTTGENFIPLAQKQALWDLLRTFYAGQTLVTDLVGTIGPIPQACAAPLPPPPEDPPQPELKWGDPGEMKTPIMAEVAKANGWDIVELPAVSEALEKRATRPARSKRSRRAARS